MFTYIYGAKNAKAITIARQRDRFKSLFVLFITLIYEKESDRF